MVVANRQLAKLEEDLERLEAQKVMYGAFDGEPTMENRLPSVNVTDWETLIWWKERLKVRVSGFPWNVYIFTHAICCRVQGARRMLYSKGDVKESDCSPNSCKPWALTAVLKCLTVSPCVRVVLFLLLVGWCFWLSIVEFGALALCLGCLSAIQAAGSWNGGSKANRSTGGVHISIK
jgi:hypothetical protein